MMFLEKFPSVAGGHLISLLEKRRDIKPPPLRVEGDLRPSCYE